jgi:hypothetical protein
MHILADGFGSAITPCGHIQYFGVWECLGQGQPGWLGLGFGGSCTYKIHSMVSLTYPPLFPSAFETD